MNKKDSVYLVAFFKFSDEGPAYGFKRIDLHRIFKTEEEARLNMSFCDEAGWYEGALIEEREFGFGLFNGKRVWLLQKENGDMEEIAEPPYYNNVVNIIG